MSIRLNKSHKEDIARKARHLSPLNKKLEEAIIKQYEVADKVRIFGLGGAEKYAEYKAVADKIQKLSASLPEHIALDNAGIYMTSWVNYTIPSLSYRSGMRLTEGKVSSKDSVKLLEGNPLILEIDQVKDEIAAIQRQLKDIQETVYASISKITTVKKLLEVWAEAEELLPRELLQPKALLPALQSYKLNKMIGLPIDKKDK